MEIKNGLPFDIVGEIKINKGQRRGAGKKNSRGEYAKKVPKSSNNGKGKLEIFFDQINPPDIDILKVFLTLPRLPKSPSGYEGFKVTGGKGNIPPHNHDIQYLIDRKEITITYDLKGHSNEEKEDLIRHVDPDIIHPDDPEQ